MIEKYLDNEFLAQQVKDARYIEIVTSLSKMSKLMVFKMQV